VELFGFGRENASQLAKVARREGQRARGKSSVGFPDFLGWFIEVHTGKTDAAHNKSASGTISRWVPKAATGTAQVTATTDLEDSGTDDTAFNLFANVGSGKWVIYIRVFYSFYIISAEC
jgi:hypothetical protein